MLKIVKNVKNHLKALMSQEDFIELFDVEDNSVVFNVKTLDEIAEGVVAYPDGEFLFSDGLKTKIENGVVVSVEKPKVEEQVEQPVENNEATAEQKVENNEEQKVENNEAQVETQTEESQVETEVLKSEIAGLKEEIENLKAEIEKLTAESAKKDEDLKEAENCLQDVQNFYLQVSNKSKEVRTDIKNESYEQSNFRIIK